MVEKSTIVASTSLILSIFHKFQRSHVIGELNVDASVGKGEKSGG